MPGTEIFQESFSRASSFGVNASVPSLDVGHDQHQWYIDMLKTPKNMITQFARACAVNPHYGSPKRHFYTRPASLLYVFNNTSMHNRRRLLPKRPLHLLPLHLRPRLVRPRLRPSRPLSRNPRHRLQLHHLHFPQLLCVIPIHTYATRHSPHTQTTPAATPPGAGKSSKTPTPQRSSTSSSTNSATAAVSPPGVPPPSSRARNPPPDRKARTTGRKT